MPRSATDRARVLLPLAALVVGTLASVTATAYLHRVQNADTRERFTNRSLETVHALNHGLDASGDALRGVRGLFEGSSDVTALDFTRFVNAIDVDERFPGVGAVGYVRADDARTVAFAEPNDAAGAFEGGAAADVAMERARDSGDIAATAPLRVPGSDDVTFLVYVPIYRAGGTPATLADRRSGVAGWVAASYRGDPFVAGQLARGHAVESALYFGPAVTDDARVGETPGYARALGDGPGLVRETPVTAFGTRWVVRTVAPPGFTPLSYAVAPWLLLCVSLALTVVTALVLRVLLTARGRAEAEVEATTASLRANEERFRALADSAPSGVFFADDAGGLAYGNPRLAAIAGLGDLTGDLPSLVHDAERERFTTAWQRAVAERSVFRGTYRLVRPDGTARWVDLAAGPTRDERGTVTGWVGTAHDVTDRVESKRRNDRLTRMLEHTSDLVTLTDPAGGVVWANDAARRFMRAAGIVPHALDDLVAPSAREFFNDVVLPAVHGEGRWTGELMLNGADGEFPVSQLVQAHYGADGQLHYYSFSARDLSERLDYQTRLAHEALHDRLTGLPNRALFVDRLTQSLARTARRESLVAVLFVDIDRFKVVNDGLGHEAGDRLLLEVAARLQNVLRSSDTAARFGGDEFTLLCEEVVDEAQAAAIAQRVLSVVSVPFVLDGSPVHVTASVGIVLSDGDSARPEELLRDADAALHRAKERGKARFELFDERVRARAVARFETETALHEALDLGQLRLYYQPEIDLRTGRVVGAEALVRWKHPQKGIVQPDDFVPLAEESGLIGQIGTWVLREACAQAAKWSNARDDGEPFVVWVNLSPRQLAGQDVVTMVENALRETRVSPAQIGLEVTESALLSDADAAIDVLARLRALGVRIVIDDFGTGYSSLAYLRRLPVDGVKIDRQFVAGLGESPEDSAIVRAVLGMATALGLDTIAEGVESQEHLDELVRLGCGYAQGYYFARPAPKQGIDALVADPPQWPGLTAPGAPDVTPLEQRRRLRRGQGA